VRNMRWLVVALIVVGGIWGGLELRDRLAERSELLFPGFRSGDAAKITIRAADRRAVLQKQDGSWIVASEDSFPAEAQAVEDLLTAVAGLSRNDKISSNPEKHQLYQVDSSGVAVTLEDSRGKLVASLVVGRMGPDYQSTYVRDAGSGDVVLAQGYLGPVFDRGKRSWLDKRVFAVDPAEAVEMGASIPAGTTVLLRDPAEKWYLSRPESASCDQAAASRLLRSLAQLRCEAFAGRTARPDWGLAQADSAVWLKTRDGVEHRLLIGKSDESGRRYAARADGGPVYLISPVNVKAITPDAAALLPKQASQP
jgi:hypothetical protein